MKKVAAEAPVREIPKATLDEIVALARQQVAAEAVVADITTALSDANAILTRISMEDLPYAMKEAGMKEFTMDSGEKIEIKHDFAVGILKANEDRAFQWLETKGHGGLIGTDVIVSFGKGETAKAEQLLEVLQKRKFEVALKRAIHFQTLKAWVNEMDREKKKFPADLFGAHPIDKAKITAPKVKK